MDNQENIEIQNPEDKKNQKSPNERSNTFAGLVLTMLIIILTIVVAMNSSVFTPALDQARYNANNIADSVNDTTVSTFGGPVRSSSDAALTNSFDRLITWTKVLAASIMVTAVSAVIIVVALLGISRQLKEITEKINR